jgi:hypothetical protein
MKKVGLADWRTSSGLPSASDPETEADRTPRESLLACMTANREPSNQSFETDREATVCTASRRFLPFGSTPPRLCSQVKPGTNLTALLDIRSVRKGKVSPVGSKVRIRFKVSVIENACLVARAVDLMTNDRFLEGYSLIRDMQANDFLIALRMLAEHGVMIKKLCDFKERHKTKETESIAALLTRAAETGDQEAISLLAAGALERRV